MEISEIRAIDVKNCIVTLGNARSLAKNIEDICRNTSEDNKWKFRIFIYCKGKTSFQCEDSSIFEEDSILSNKRVTHIKIEAKGQLARIEIELTHGDGIDNKVLVQGVDSTWVNGTLRKIEESIGSFQPQSVIIKKYQWVALPSVAVGIGVLFMLLVEHLPIEHSTGQSSHTSLLLKYIVAFVLGIGPASFLYEKLKSLWPSIELQIGPDHTFIEKNRRSYMALIFVVGIAPLLTSLLYDLMK